MSVYEQVQKCLNFNIEADHITRQQALDSAIPQWHYALNLFYDFVEFYGHCKVKRLYMDRGFLHANCEDTKFKANYGQMISEKTLYLSIIKCWVTGKRGYKRKSVKGTPILCRDAFISYINEAADLGDDVYLYSFKEEAVNHDE